MITPLSANFCAGCNRIRVAATGTVYGCLGHDQKVELRDLLRTGGIEAASVSEEERNRIFQENHFATGQFTWRGIPVDPGAITDTDLLTALLTACAAPPEGAAPADTVGDLAPTAAAHDRATENRVTKVGSGRRTEDLYHWGDGAGRARPLGCRPRAGLTRHPEASCICSAISRRADSESDPPERMFATLAIINAILYLSLMWYMDVTARKVDLSSRSEPRVK